MGVRIPHPLPTKTPPVWVVFLLAEDEGFERAAPVRTLVQKVSGGHFLARGRIHGLRNAPGTGVGLSPFLFWIFIILEKHFDTL